MKQMRVYVKAGYMSNHTALQLHLSGLCLVTIPPVYLVPYA